MAVPVDISFDEYWKTARERLEPEFESFVPQFFNRLPAIHVAAVQEVLTGGKRLRAALVCLLNDAMGGDPAAAIPRAMAVECVQAASLIHDDLVDGDISRRNRPATWTVQGSRRAVLLGDLIFATALQRMTELSRDDGLALGEAIASMASGAYQELAPSELADGASEDPAGLYPRIIFLKTGMLFGTAARLGVLAAGGSGSLAALAFEYGARTGEAYQMADDLQDLVDQGSDAPAAADQLPLLAPALWHFCADAQPPGQEPAVTRDTAARLRPYLRKRMRAAIEDRLEQALAAADQIPSGPHAMLLRTAPGEIVRAMTLGGR